MLVFAIKFSMIIYLAYLKASINVLIQVLGY